MLAASSRLAGVIVLILVLAACTRERPTPEPTVLPDSTALTAPETPTSETEIDQPESTPVSNGEPTVLVDATPTGQATPTPESDDTFQYTVQPGDTLSTIAEQFGTDIETIRRLNRLGSDELFVGQPLYVPYVEGMTAEGLPTPTPGPFYYTIEPGDTLGLIAQQFGVDQLRIIETNNLLDPNNLTVGATILIPGYQPTAGTETDEDVADGDGDAGAATAGGGERVLHQVQPGEGLYQIAERYGIDAAEIAAANGITLQDLLNVGQELIIPGITADEAILARSITHVVQAGENLFGIAVRYGVTVEEILEANNLTDPDTISIGQRLLIPTD